MKNITSFLLKDELEDFKNIIEFKKFNQDTLLEDIINAEGKYINFIKDVDYTADDYFKTLIERSTLEFDVCFINYTIEVDGKTVSTEQLEAPEIQKKPYAGDYIWCYMWRKEKLIEFLKSEDQSNDFVDSLFQAVNYIEKPLYHHIPSEPIIKDFIYVDEKEEVRRKNVIYVGTYCNGQFNGYITWLNNLGRCFGDDYKITILYDKIYEPTREVFEKHFETIKREENKNYICDRLSVTYSTYYYPKNILVMDENYMFILGNMTDYKSARKYKYDNYTKYIGVSKISAKKAEGFFPTDHFDYILNPIKLDRSEIKPHLKFVSAMRNDPIKKIGRIHRISEILDEEVIPYTWNVFIDTLPFESPVYGGVVYRRSVQNPLSYVEDADYYVQLSDSEAYCYSVAEALSLNTKVIVTPLECYDELKVDETQGFIIPFEYFDPENKEKLREVVHKIVEDKDKEMHNKLDPSMFEGYKEIFIK